MKSIFTLFFVCFSSVLVAQGPGGQSPRGTKSAMASQSKNIPEFKSATIAGIHSYDIPKVLKKLKIKETDSIAETVSNLITTYNLGLAQIGTKHKDLFEGLDIVVNLNIETAIKYKNRETLMTTLTMAMEKLNPVIIEVKQKDLELTNSLENVLNEAKYDKWVKYQKAESEKRFPNFGGPNNGNRQRPNGANRNGRPTR